MSKQIPGVEWYVAETDAEWVSLCAPPGPDMAPKPAPAAQAQVWPKQLLWGIVTMLLLIAGAGRWWLHIVQTRLPESEVELRTTARPEHQPPVTSFIVRQTAADWQRQLAQDDNDLRTTIQADILAEETDTHVDIGLHTIEFWGQLAIAHVIMPGVRGSPPYRQTRSYQQMGPDWRQVAPNTALWGPERSLETSSFIFRFRQNDATTVIAVASQVETLYTTLRHNFGLPITPGAKKLVIEVGVTQSPGRTIPWFGAPERILVPSPAVYLAPIELTNAEILAQSLALLLLAQVSAQASEHYQIGSAWQPLLDGLRLWQVWDLDLPLAAWREEIVQWLYLAVPAPPPGQVVVLPEHYPALCAAHKLWISSPAQMNIPLVCTELDSQDWFFTSWGPRDPLTRLDQLTVPLPLHH